MGVPVTYNIRNLLERKGTTLMTAVGIGLTVAVLVVALALTEGLKSVFAASGHPTQILVMRKAANSELSSTVTADTYQIIRRLPGIELGKDGEPLASPEGLTVVNLPSVDNPEGMNVTVRGLLPIGLSMRDVKLREGSMFAPGLRQVVVGESIARRYPDARIGKQLKFGRGVWDVVGVFSVGETAANSEIWADLNQLRGDFEQSEGGSNSLLVRLTNDEAARSLGVMREQDKTWSRMAEAEQKAHPELKPAPPKGTLMGIIADDQRLGSTSIGETEYYAQMTESGMPLQVLGFAVAIIMAVGSAFAATNTMYAAVARRSREIGTLRALGFGRWTILRSFMLESICLSLVGGIIGVLISLPLNGFGTAVGSFVSFSETAFKFKVTGGAIAAGLIFAAVIGALGGFLPAWSASKKGIVATMREV